MAINQGLGAVMGQGQLSNWVSPGIKENSNRALGVSLARKQQSGRVGVIMAFYSCGMT